MCSTNGVEDTGGALVNGALVNKGDEAEIWNYAISVPSFEKITQLTLVQQQAFDLLGLHL